MSSVLAPVPSADHADHGSAQSETIFTSPMRPGRQVADAWGPEAETQQRETEKYSLGQANAFAVAASPAI